MNHYGIGIDVGGTTIKLGIFDETGILYHEATIKTRAEQQGAFILTDIADAVQRSIKDSGIDQVKIIGIGIGIPGPVDALGVVSECVNLGWKQTAVTASLEAATGLPCLAENDANVAALGEVWKGGGAGYHNMVMMTLGTGVGGGIILQDHIQSGAHHAGGELGHIKVHLDETEVCGCGKKGCLEQYASASGIVRMAKNALQQYPASRLAKMTTFTCKDVFDAMEQQDELAAIVVSKVNTYLAHACATISCVCDPEVFVIGGGVSLAGAALLTGIQEQFQTFCFPSAAKTEFKLAVLGNQAGIYGAVKLVFDRLL